MRKCTVCGRGRLDYEFVKDDRRQSGERSYCIYCRRMWDKDRYERDKEKRYEAQKKRLKKDDIRERNNVWRKEYYHKNRHRYLANAKVKYAIKTGKLIKSAKCEECDKTDKLQGHHKDYFKPLEVKWLCQICHDKYKIYEKYKSPYMHGSVKNREW